MLTVPLSPLVASVPLGGKWSDAGEELSLVGDVFRVLGEFGGVEPDVVAGGDCLEVGRVVVERVAVLVVHDVATIDRAVVVLVDGDVQVLGLAGPSVAFEVDAV